MFYGFHGITILLLFSLDSAIVSVNMQDAIDGDLFSVMPYQRQLWFSFMSSATECMILAFNEVECIIIIVILQ